MHMRNLLRTVLSIAYAGFGLFCFVYGNPVWLVSLGFSDGILPALCVTLGLGLGAVALLHAWPISENSKTHKFSTPSA